MKRTMIPSGLGMFFILAVTALGAVPQLINFQGVLRQPNGNPVTDGSYSVTFTIYEVPTGGTALWTETQSVSTSGGLFAVLLGSTTPVPDSVFKGSDRYLGIAVSPDGELSPRQRLASVGYSYRVNSIDGATGGTISGNTAIQSDLSVAGTIDAPGMSSKIRFHFNDFADFPSPTTYHGMFAHAHNQGAAYYAHAAQWVRLADSAHPHSSLAASDLSPNPALSVDADGKVGIGTTSPSRKLHVVESTNNSGIRLGAPGNQMDLVSLFEGGKNSLGFYNDLGQTLLRVHNGGETWLAPGGSNVGIGTTLPTKKLEVAGSVKVGANDTVFSSNLASNSPLSLQAPAGTVRMFINDVNGNVGIGTTSPPNKLSVTGSADFSGNVGIGTTNSGTKLHLVGDAVIPPGFVADNQLVIRPASDDKDVAIGLRTTQTATDREWSIRAGSGAANTNFRIYDATAGSDRLNIDGTGNVGIGTTSPTEKLHVVGNICATGSFLVCSDARFKRSVKPIEGSLDKIEKLQGVTYKWNRDEYPQFAEGNQIGFVAQEVMGILPEVVSEGSDGTLSVDYGRFSVVLLEAIKEQQKEIKELKAAIEKLQVERR